jgi:UDP:flavonoid glycosyltransferase YjiC (YdhE family)
MRVLFTCLAYTGHFHPLVPLARAVAAEGHEVAFATHPALGAQVARAGFRHFPAGLAPHSPEVSELWAEAEAAGLRGEAVSAFAAGRDFVALRAARFAADLLPLLERWPADLLVRDELEFGACVVAERLGRPHAAVSVQAAGVQPGALGWVAGPLDALRAAHGLPPDPRLRMPFRYLTLHPAPPRFRSGRRRPTDRTIRPVPFDASGDESLPAWAEALPARPTVYATLGTAFNDRPEVFAAILEALRDETLNVVLTVGRDQDPARLGPQPGHIRVERYVPQTQLLPRCDLVLSHGGSGTVLAALAQGLPQVVLPLAADQPQNAARCAALGLGRVVPGREATPAAIRDAVRAVLADGRYRRNARRLRDEIAALPGPEHAVPWLERLAAEGRPVGAAA